MSFASSELRALIEAHVPHRPWCGQVKNAARVRPRATALQSPYLQLNPPCSAAWLIFDLDYEGSAIAWERCNLPPPTYIAGNPGNGKAHIGYALAAPVCTSAAGRGHPVRYLSAIENAFMRKLRADVAFHGPLSKNPLHPAWRIWEPANAPTYELGHLAEYVSLPDRLPRRRSEAGIGRNCSLFDDLAAWAYRSIRGFWQPGGEDLWRRVVRDKADEFNVFEVPLGVAEVAGVARSVARWTWRHTTPAGFRASQSEKGRKGGKAKGAANEDKRVSARVMRAAGLSAAQIASELNVHRDTVYSWTKVD